MNTYMNITVRILASQAQRMLAQLQRQVNGLSFANGIAGANGFGAALNGMRIDRFGSQMQWLGRQIEYNFTLPLALAGAAVTKMALDQEKALTRIKKVYGDAGHDAEFYKEEIKALEKAFVALSNQFGIAQADALNIAADWAAAGASGLALAKSVQLTMKTMVLGEMEAAEATKALIAIQAQYGLSIDELTKTINILNMVENQTGTSMKDLVDGFSRAAGVARSAGVSVRELAADIAALTPATGSAANAGNALKTIFSRLMSPTNDAIEVMQLMGINTKSMAWQASNAQEKLILMAHAFEDLSDAQKGFVSSIIASRYQVNRFEVLMAELISDHGYYARALNATADATAVYNQAQKELNAVLTSSPQRLKIIWTTMQNAATDIIQPLIPMILWLAEAIQKLVSSFANLNPAVQKFILFGFALIAIVGPVIRYLGAFQILLFELTGLFKLLLVPVGATISALWTLIKLPVAAVLGVWGIALKGALKLFGLMPLIARGAVAGVQIVFMAMSSSLPRLVLAGLMATLTVTQMWIPAMVGAFIGMVATQISVVQRFLLWLPNVWAIATKAVTAIHTAWAATLAFISAVHWNGIRHYAILLWTSLPKIWATGLAAVQTISTSFMVAASLSWKGFLVRLAGLVRTGSTAVMAAMTGPWGIALSAVIILVAIFWDEIKQMFRNAASWFTGNSKNIAGAFQPFVKMSQSARDAILKAFNALPSGIQKALLAVVRTVAAAAKAVYSWLSYINPWARHSPSLVDNVTTGVAEIKKQYSSLGTVGNAFGSVIDNLELFRQATESINRSVEKNKYAEIRKDLLDMAAAAVPAFDAIVKELFELEDQLKSVEAAMEAQEEVVDGLKDQLDEANDALDKQKDILQKMKDEADQYQDTINRINGDLEVLTGTREALRTAGAGSDILGPMDEQIKKLREQKKGVNDQLDAAKKAYDDQKKLVDDLTAARDKLQESYDAEKKKLEEIKDAYEKIRDRIRDITDAIQDFATSVDALKNAGGKGGLADQFNAGAGADFGDVGGSGGLGREGGIEDQAKQIEEFTKQLQDETKKMFGMFNFLDPIKKGWNAAWGWVKTTFGPLASVIADFVVNLFSGIPNPFAGNSGLTDGFKTFTEGIKSIMEGLKAFVEAAWRLIGPPLMELWGVIKEALGGAMEQIAPQIQKFKDLWEPLQKLWMEIVPILKVLGAIIGGVLLLAFTIIVDVLKNAVGPIINWIIDVIKSLIQIIRGIIEVIVGVFTGDWELAWQGIKDIFIGTWNIIWSTLKNAVLLIWGIIKGLVEGIVDFFVWLWDELVGHSVVPDIVNGILFWFDLMNKAVKVIMDVLVSIIKWVWENMIKPIWDAMVAAWKWVVDKIKEGVEEWQRRFDILKQVLAILWAKYKEVVDAIKGKFWELVNNAKEIVSQVKGHIDDFVEKILGIKNRIHNAWDNIFDGLKSAFKSAVNWIIGKWNDMKFGIGPFAMETPNIPFLARGGKTNGPAVVGEGRQAYPEYVIPTDPQYRKRAWGLLEELAGDLGVKHLLGSGGTMRQFGQALSRGIAGDKIQFFARGGVIGGGRLRGSVRGGVMLIQREETATYHFHGDLSFPNVKDGSDAGDFIENLRALVGKK